MRPWVILAQLALLSRLAVAAPLEDTTVGGAVFTGPTQAHPTAIQVNPAALGLGTRGSWTLYIAGSLQLDQIGIDRRKVDATGTAVADENVSARVFSPAGTIAVYKVLSTNVALGVSFGLPLSESFIADRDALRYHTLGGYFRQWSPNVAVSFRPTERLYVGLGTSLARGSLRLQFARDTALEAGTPGVQSDCGGAPCGVENPLASETYTIDTRGPWISSTNIALTAGLVFQLAERWWLGAAYQSPPGFLSALRLDGEVTVERAPRDGGGTLKGSAEVVYRLPQTFWLGLRGAVLPGFELVIAARYQNLSEQNRFDVRLFGGELVGTDIPEFYPRYRGLADTVAVDLGLEQTERAALRLGGRLRFESAGAETEALSPLQVAMHNVTASVGAELRLSPRVVLTASYGLSYFLPTTGGSGFDPLARIACVDSNFELEACRAAAEGRALPTALADYERISHALRLSLRVPLSF